VWEEWNEKENGKECSHNFWIHLIQLCSIPTTNEDFTLAHRSWATPEDSWRLLRSESGVDRRSSEVLRNGGKCSGVAQESSGVVQEPSGVVQESWSTSYQMWSRSHQKQSQLESSGVLKSPQELSGVFRSHQKWHICSPWIIKCGLETESIKNLLGVLRSGSGSVGECQVQG